MKVETVLEPLYNKLFLLANLPSSTLLSVRSKSRDLILSAIDGFIVSVEQQCSLLSHEIPELELEIRTALSDVLDTSRLFQLAVNVFTADPMNEQKNAELDRTGSALVTALSRLLIVAELADTSSLDELVQDLQNTIQSIVTNTSQKKLSTQWDTFRRQCAELVDLLGKRSADSSIPDYEEQNIKVQYILSTNSPLLYASSRLFLNHPEHVSVKSAKEFASNSLLEALQIVQNMLDDNQPLSGLRIKISGKLLDEIEEFENSTLVDSINEASEKQIHAQMKQHLKSILPSVYRLADATNTRSEHQQAVYTHCEQLQQKLNAFLTEYCRTPLDRSSLNASMQSLLNETGDLKQQLMRIGVHHATDTLYDRDQPLMALGDATKFGNASRMDDVSQLFQNHTSSMVNAAYELCSLTTNEEASAKVQLACSQLEQLSPQVVNAAYLLFKYPHSRSVESTFSAFRQAYEKATELLNSSLSELTSMHDILAAIDDQMSHDFKIAVRILSNSDDTEFQRISTSMQRRSVHVCDLVQRNLQLEVVDNSDYVDRVMETLTLLKDEFTPTFIEISRETLSRLGAAQQTIDISKFQRAGRNLCNAVHDVRMTVLNATNLPSELKALRATSSKETVRSSSDIRSKICTSERLSQKSTPLPTGSNERMGIVGQENRHSELIPDLYQILSAGEYETVALGVAGFLEEKKRFMREVVQWDDSTNEIVLLAKQMCVIMMEMTDFAQGKGPLRSTMEMIQAAQRISEFGTRLDNLCRDIGNMCPESEGRRDLLAYLQRITLHCHQLKITSKVKAGVHGRSSELVESTAALLQAARNLMNAVVLTVKESYIISTKYRLSNRQSLVHWKMNVPDKKPLLQIHSSATISRAGSSDVDRLTSSRALAQFDRVSTPTSNHRS